MKLKCEMSVLIVTAWKNKMKSTWNIKRKSWRENGLCENNEGK